MTQGRRRGGLPARGEQAHRQAARTGGAVVGHERLPLHNSAHTSLPIPTPLPAFTSDDEAMTALESVAKDIKTVDAWHLQFELLTTIRRLVLHHPDSMDKKTYSSAIVPFVTEKVRGGGGGGGGGEGLSPSKETG